MPEKGPGVSALVPIEPRPNPSYFCSGRADPKLDSSNFALGRDCVAIAVGFEYRFKRYERKTPGGQNA